MKPSLHVLKNGVRAALIPCAAESVAVGVFVASGSRHESAKTAGISHFIEHMLFKGTPTRKTIDITRAIEGRGGNFNAGTSEEATCYYTHLPCEYLAEAVDIFADMYLNASIPDGEFAREKRVILEEIKMYADDPGSVAAENLQRALFPGSRLGLPIAGSAKSLLPLAPEDLRRYVRAHYLSSNTIVAIAGKFDEAEALACVERGFGGLPRSRRKPPADDPFAAKPSPETKAERDVQQTQLALGYRTFGAQDPRKYAATVMDAILGRGMSSRLFQEVREKRGLSYDISSRMQFFSDAGMLSVTAGLDGKKADKALRTVEREIDRICTKKAPAAEIKRVKEFLTGNFRMAHERVTSKMFYYGQNLLMFGRLMDPAELTDAVRAVTAEEIRSVAQTIFAPENRSISWVTPKSAKAAAE